VLENLDTDLLLEFDLMLLAGWQDEVKDSDDGNASSILTPTAETAALWPTRPDRGRRHRASAGETLARQRVLHPAREICHSVV
jgi:hypothetical protein